jgi:phage terminase large subunit-like protein
MVSRIKENSLQRYQPYSKQQEFHAAGLNHKERLFMAGNQLGKTVAGGFEAAMHATGRYPEGWQGRVFTKETAGWVASVTGESTRDNVQRILLGRPGEHGTGAIPKESIIGVTMSRGVPNLADGISVRHVNGNTSHIGLKSYEKGREKWQGETLDWVWFDEEPPIDVYTEGVTRTNSTNGLTWLTFTPLKGMSSVVDRFLMEKNADRIVTQMTIEDAPHYTQEEREKIIAAYPAHEREARAMGVPIMGSGRVFPIEEALIEGPVIDIPPHWPRICGLDLGWDHPTAAVWLAWDRDTDTVYVTDCYRLREETPVVHAAAIKARGDWIPVSWPHDGLQHDKGSGIQIAEQYKAQGIAMLDERATFDDGSNGVEAGVMDILDRMKTGRFRVAKHLEDWWQEFRLYHRKSGQIVKERDDLMSATRYGVMMLRHARVKPETVEMNINTDWVT